MPLSQVQICNLALSRIGITQAIDSIDEASNEARQCKLLFDPCLEDLISSHDWPFANRIAELGLVEENPTPSWTYSYRLPADYLKVNFIEEDDSEEFQISSDASGGLFYSNLDSVTLNYTASITDIGIIPTDVAWVLAGKLAYELAPALSRSDSVIERAFRWYQDKLREALINRIGEPKLAEMPDAEAISERE
jgi:hypothetical protein